MHAILFIKTIVQDEAWGHPGFTPPNPRPQAAGFTGDGDNVRHVQGLRSGRVDQLPWHFHIRGDQLINPYSRGLYILYTLYIPYTIEGL